MIKKVHSLAQSFSKWGTKKLNQEGGGKLNLCSHKYVDKVQICVERSKTISNIIYHGHYMYVCLISYAQIYLMQQVLGCSLGCSVLSMGQGLFMLSSSEDT